MIQAIRKAVSKQEGAALFVSLLVTLVLVLLGITLLLMSGTEHLLSTNERDSQDALAKAESGLQWAKRMVLDYTNNGPPYPTDLDALLLGPDGTTGTADDNLLGIKDLTLGLTNTVSINGNNEETASAIVSKDFGDGTAMNYEVFRLGTDSDGVTGWDGPRALVYVRFFDNLDDGAVDSQTNDQDLRARIKVVAEYPIFVSTQGGIPAVQDTNVNIQRGQARRVLIGRVGPQDQQAILANKDLDMVGTVDVCGECGGVHSNANFNLGGQANDDVDICADATATGTMTVTNNGTLNGYVGYAPHIDVPVINPYDDIFVPLPATFNHASDTELANGPDGIAATADDSTYNPLKCTFDPIQDPGASKYFALVIRKTSGKHGYIFKGYWNVAENRWDWRLIDDLDDSDNTILDDCGRVISGTITSTGEVLVSDLTLITGGYVRTDTAASVDDGDASKFYNFDIHSNYGTVSCAADDTLSGLASNDYNPNTFRRWLAPGSIAPHLLGADVPPLPGNNPVPTPTLPNEPDGSADFIIADAMGKNDAVWKIASGNNVYSPTFNAVIWIYGNFDFEGGHDNLTLSTLTTTLPILPPPQSRAVWRASFITFGGINTAGSVNYAPANGSNYLLPACSGAGCRFAGNFRRWTEHVSLRR